MQEGPWFVYFLASQRNGTLYIGVTNSLLKRINEHRLKINKESFTAKYNVTQLVYYEMFGSIKAAIKREKQLKKWKRLWKLKLIDTVNPEWKDLYNDLNN